MRITKFFSAILFISTFITAIAAPNMTFFTSLSQAEQFCPAANQLSFLSKSKAPDAAGQVTGNFQGKSFQSKRNALPAPDSIINKYIQNMNFRTVTEGSQEIYGYTSGLNTVCLYQYKNFTGNNTAIIVQTA